MLYNELSFWNDRTILFLWNAGQVAYGTKHRISDVVSILPGSCEDSFTRTHKDTQGMSCMCRNKKGRMCFCFFTFYIFWYFLWVLRKEVPFQNVPEKGIFSLGNAWPALRTWESVAPQEARLSGDSNSSGEQTYNWGKSPNLNRDLPQEEAEAKAV